MDKINETNENRPIARCSACGATLKITVTEETDIVFSTETTEGSEKKRVNYTVVPCTCPEPEDNADGEKKHVVLVFGELDEQPESESAK